MQGHWRVIGSGQTLVPANSSVNLLTATRESGEVLTIFAWLVEDVAGVAFTPSTPIAPNLGYWLERLPVTDQFLARAQNASLIANRTLRWAVVGIGT